MLRGVHHDKNIIVILLSRIRKEKRKRKSIGRVELVGRGSRWGRGIKEKRKRDREREEKKNEGIYRRGGRALTRGKVFLLSFKKCQISTPPRN